MYVRDVGHIAEPHSHHLSVLNLGLFPSSLWNGPSSKLFSVGVKNNTSLPITDFKSFLITLAKSKLCYGGGLNIWAKLGFCKDGKNRQRVRQLFYGDLPDSLSMVTMTESQRRMASQTSREFQKDKITNNECKILNLEARRSLVNSVQALMRWFLTFWLNIVWEPRKWPMAVIRNTVLCWHYFLSKFFIFMEVWAKYSEQ